MSKGEEIGFKVYESLGTVVINSNLTGPLGLRFCFRSMEQRGLFQVRHRKPNLKIPTEIRPTLGFRCKSR